MARSYRRVDQAETYLLKVKGALDEADTRVTSSAWFTLGLVAGWVDEALGCLAAPASKAGADAYTRGAEMVAGYVQDHLPLGE